MVWSNGEEVGLWFVSREKLSGLVCIVQGGSGSVGGVALLSSASRCAVAILMISAGSRVTVPEWGSRMEVSFGVSLARGLMPADTLSP